jgi:hypothetical protein
VDPLVLSRGDEGEVLEPVVVLVLVDVVDLHPGRDGSVRSLPDDVVLEPEPSVEAAPDVALPGAVWASSPSSRATKKNLDGPPVSPSIAGMGPASHSL